MQPNRAGGERTHQNVFSLPRASLLALLYFRSETSFSHPSLTLPPQVLLLRASDPLAQAHGDPAALRAAFHTYLPQFSRLVNDAALAQVAAKPPSRLPSFRYVGPRLHHGSTTVRKIEKRQRKDKLQGAGAVRFVFLFIICCFRYVREGKFVLVRVCSVCARLQLINSPLRNCL